MPLPRKPHSFGNEYHSIASRDGGKPIMWRVKIVEGKDRMKKSDGTWAFPSKWTEGVLQHREAPSGYGKPLHHMGKVVTGNSIGFGSTTSTIVDIILLDWNKHGRQNGGNTDNFLSCFWWRR